VDHPKALRLRRSRPDLFSGYQAVRASGPAQDHLIGFDRGGAITLATRLPIGLAAAGGWRDTAVEISSPHIDLLSGRHRNGTVAVRDILISYPVALLAPE
jgi:(1->4)-alpha-D-glucan 1-alpha-D-glucosylmutase